MPPRRAPVYNAGMQTVVIALLGTVIAVHAYAMPELGDSAQGPGPRVTVQRGVAWFYGHRYQAPFTLEYSPDGLAIDGYFLSREVGPLPNDPPTHGDTMISELSARTLKILRDARSNHVAREEAFARVKQAYRSSPIVKKVELRGYSLILTYRGRPGSYMVLLVDPKNIGQPNMTSEELDEKRQARQRKSLQQLKDHFESAGIVVWFDAPTYTLLPHDHSFRVDVLLRRLQRKAKITDGERAFLEATIPTSFHDFSRITERPLRLTAVSSHPED